MQELLQAIFNYGFPSVVSVILLISMIKSQSSLEESYSKIVSILEEVKTLLGGKKNEWWKKRL